MRAAIIGFFTSLDILANMVSIGTLFAFFMVASSLFFYRAYDPHTSTPKVATTALIHMFLIWAASLGARTFMHDVVAKSGHTDCILARELLSC